MKLDDINKALDALIAINGNLTEEKLRLLLTSSGWETSSLEEAVILFKSRNIPSVDLNADAKKDTSVQNIPAVEVSTTVEESKSKILTDVSHDELLPEIYDNGGVLTLFENKEALIVKEQDNNTFLPKEENKNEQTGTFSISKPPDNLPLRVYEMSHMVLPLHEYEEKFLGKVDKDETGALNGVSSPEKNVEGEKSHMHYVFLALCMLFLVLIILLGYTYN